MLGPEASDLGMVEGRAQGLGSAVVRSGGCALCLVLFPTAGGQQTGGVWPGLPLPGRGKVGRNGFGGRSGAQFGTWRAGAQQRDGRVRGEVQAPLLAWEGIAEAGTLAKGCLFVQGGQGPSLNGWTESTRLEWLESDPDPLTLSPQPQSVLRDPLPEAALEPREVAH